MTEKCPYHANPCQSGCSIDCIHYIGFRRKKSEQNQTVGINDMFLYHTKIQNDKRAKFTHFQI